MSMVHSSIAAEALSLSGGCEVTIYINRLVSEILQVDGSQLNIIAYTDNQSLYDAVHSMKQTFEKRLIVDISSIWGNRSSVSKKKWNRGYIDRKGKENQWCSFKNCCIL